MEPNPQFLEDLVTFTKKFLNGKLYILCSVKDPEVLGIRKVKFSIKFVRFESFSFLYPKIFAIV